MTLKKPNVVFCSIVLVTAIGCYVALGAAFCSATLHVRRQRGHRPDGAISAQIVASDQTKLNAWWFRNSAGDGRCAIVLHGIGDSRSSSAGFAPMFLRHGYSVLTPDSRGHGDSGGRFVTYGLLEKHDVIAWTHWMQAQGCQRIYGLGESLGASILIQATAVESIFNAIVAECPYADLRQVAEYRIEQQLPIPHIFSSPLAAFIVEAGLDYALLFNRFDFRKASPEISLRHSTTPALLVHGLEDRRTPPAQSKLLIAAHSQNNCLWLVPGASHTNASVVASSEFERRVFEWFENH